MARYLISFDDGAMDFIPEEEGPDVAAAAAGLADHRVPPLGGEHPLVQPFARVAERCLARLTFARAEAVERDGEVMHAGE